MQLTGHMNQLSVGQPLMGQPHVGPPPPTGAIGLSGPTVSAL